MKPEQHAALTAKAKMILLFEEQYKALGNQLGALKKDGVPDIELQGVREAKDGLTRSVKRWKRELALTWGDLPVAQWADSIHGLGDAVVLVLGLMPRLTDFPNPAKVWAYAGLTPEHGRKKGQNHKYSHDLKSAAIVRLAKPCMNKRKSPFRKVYDDRRAHTEIEHPEWSDGHHHNDALRITAKAILLDMWLVAHGKSPKVGQADRDTQ